MEIKNVDNNMKWSEYCNLYQTDTLYVSNDSRSRLVTIAAGTGDELMEEDMEEGYVDYWCMEAYGDSKGGSGMIMKEEYIAESNPTIGQILYDVCEEDPELFSDGDYLIDAVEGRDLENLFLEAEIEKLKK